MTANEEQRAYWAERGREWVDFEAHLERFTEVFGRLAMQRLEPTPGERILDVGCGAGKTTLDLARAVGPGGKVVGVDLSPPMLVRARERADDAGHHNVRFVEADAQVATFDEEFDAVFSRYGVMFFEDPVAAFANIRRALRPGGRMVAAVWQDASLNEWWAVPLMAVATVTGQTPETPGRGQPGPFAFAEPSFVHRILGEAGFEEIGVEPEDHTIVIPSGEIDDYVSTDMRVRIGRMLPEDADDALRTRVELAIREEFAERTEHGEVKLRAAAFIVTARSPTGD